MNQLPPSNIGDFEIGSSAIEGVRPHGVDLCRIETGGVAIDAIAGPANGGYIQNPPSAAAQGIAVAENIYVDATKAPGCVDDSGNGTTAVLRPGDILYLTPFDFDVIWRINAATGGHLLTIIIW